MSLSIILLVISFFGCWAQQPFPVKKGTEGWNFMLNETGVMFEWKKPENNRSITMQLRLNHSGWVGVGFCRPRVRGDLISGKMQNCDIALAWVDQDGTPHVCDTWASSNGRPQRDTEQNFRVLSSSKEEGVGTKIQFRRNMDTQDPKDANLHNPILIAWSHRIQTKEIKFTDCFVEKHDQATAGIFEEYAILMNDPFRHEYGGSDETNSFKLIFVIMLGLWITFS